MDHDKSTQGIIRRPTSGRPRKTNERDDRHLCQMPKGDVRFTAPQITSKYEFILCRNVTGLLFKRLLKSKCSFRIRTFFYLRLFSLLWKRQKLIY